jgi:hypothetical protein
MTNMAGEFIHLSLNALGRRPLLTAMLVFLVAFGMAAFAVWRGTSGNSNPRRTELPYLVWIRADAPAKGNRYA